jgi:hypothetical protein
MKHTPVYKYKVKESQSITMFLLIDKKIFYLTDRFTLRLFCFADNLGFSVVCIY